MRNIAHNLISMLLVPSVAVGIAGCGGKDAEKPKPATQIAAKVNSGEISVHQLNYVLTRTPGAGAASPEMAPKIRREVLNVKDLSVEARNAKIITADGKVTLRGPVKSPEERDTIDRIARAAAGEGNVDNQLEVATSTTTTNPGR